MTRYPRWLHVVLALGVLALPVPVLAADSPDCLEELRAFPRNADLLVHRTDGAPLEGRLLSVDEQGRLVWVEVYDQATDRFARTALPESTLYRIDVTTRSLNPVFPLVGGLLLGIGGFLLGYEYTLAADDDGESMATGIGLIVGAFFAGVGAVAGVLFGPKRAETTHLECAAP